MPLSLCMDMKIEALDGESLCQLFYNICLPCFLPLLLSNILSDFVCPLTLSL